MGYLSNLARSNVVEHITLTTTDASAVQNAFIIIASEDLSDVAIQNLSDGGCYITFGTSAVTATINHLYMTGNSSVSLTNTKFNNFSVIRATTDVSVRITGIGAE